MKCTEFLDRLDAVAGGEVEPAEAEATRRHLDECASCRAEAERLHRLFSAVAQLPSSVEPPRDLWPGIASRINAAAQPIQFPASRRRSLIYLVAAAVLAFAAVTAVLNFNSPSSRVAGDSGVGTVGQGADGVAVVSHPTGDRAYSVRRELMAVIKSRQHEISPATMETVMANLAIIDEALESIDAALAAEPGNTKLQHLRLAVYKREAKLLKQVARMPADA